MTAPTTTDTVTLTMSSMDAIDVRKLLVEGYSSLRHDTHATPDWHMRMLRVIEDIRDQLTAGEHRD